MAKGHTVAELIAKLSRLPPDAIVWLEGCDCGGSWDGLVAGFVQYGTGRQCVGLTRDDGVDEHERRDWKVDW